MKTLATLELLIKVFPLFEPPRVLPVHLPLPSTLPPFHYPPSHYPPFILTMKRTTTFSSLWSHSLQSCQQLGLQIHHTAIALCSSLQNLLLFGSDLCAYGIVIQCASLPQRLQVALGRNSVTLFTTEVPYLKQCLLQNFSIKQLAGEEAKLVRAPWDVNTEV